MLVSSAPLEGPGATEVHLFSQSPICVCSVVLSIFTATGQSQAELHSFLLRVLCGLEVRQQSKGNFEKEVNINQSISVTVSRNWAS